MTTPTPTPPPGVDPTPTTLTLDRAPTDRASVVAEVRCEEQDAVRLKRMGICVGRRVRLVRGGEPLIVLAAGSRVGLSRQLGKAVSVTPCDGEGCMGG